jgi:hypothetical protein
METKKEGNSKVRSKPPETYGQAVIRIRREIIPKVESGSASPAEKALLALVFHTD